MPEKAKRTYRRERMRNNPISWIVLLLFTFGAFIFLVSPKLNVWLEKRSEIKEFSEKIETLRVEKDTLDLKIEDIREEFDQKSKPKLQEERQTYPEMIDHKKIAKLLEVFAEQLENTGGFGTFSLDSVNFGKTREKRKDDTSSTTDLTIEVLSNQENIEKFVKYLQTSQIPEEFLEEEWKEILELQDITTLSDNLVPLININSLRITPIKKNKDSTEILTAPLKVQIEASLFSH